MPRTLRVKTIIAGASRVGKSALKDVFLSDGVDVPKTHSFTLGAEIDSKIFSLPNKQGAVDFVLVDIGGHAEFEELTVALLDQPCALLLVYDVTDRDSLDAVKKWAKIRTDFGAALLPAVLVGNKKDLETRRVVETEEGSELAASLNCPFVETSIHDYESAISPFVLIGNELFKEFDAQLGEVSLLVT